MGTSYDAAVIYGVEITDIKSPGDPIVKFNPDTGEQYHQKTWRTVQVIADSDVPFDRDDLSYDDELILGNEYVYLGITLASIYPRDCESADLRFSTEDELQAQLLAACVERRLSPAATDAIMSKAKYQLVTLCY